MWRKCAISPTCSLENSATLGSTGVQKLEHNPVECWRTLVQLVHAVLPPPRQVFANKNPFGATQHVALWKMDGQEAGSNR